MIKLTYDFYFQKVRSSLTLHTEKSHLFLQTGARPEPEGQSVTGPAREGVRGVVVGNQPLGGAKCC